VQQAAQQIGATIDQIYPPEMFQYQSATAKWREQKVQISTFKSNDLRDNWVTVAKNFATIDQTGDRYIIGDSVGG
jgi:hypothetical protein